MTETKLTQEEIEELSPSFRITYDRASDVLYFSIRYGVSAVSREDAPGVYWRYGVPEGNLISVTIVDFDAYWRAHIEELAKDIARRFQLPQSVVLNELYRAQERK